MSLIHGDNKRAYELYTRMLSALPDEQTKSISLIVVQHFVANVVPFVEAVAQRFRKVIVIPKPNSINPSVDQRLRHGRDTNIEILSVKRDKTSDYRFFENNILKLMPEGDFIIVDIGGYFALSYLDIDRVSGGRLLGVIEDTENGHQKYEEAQQMFLQADSPKTVYSVARSPLKDPEDHLVGESIVYAIERILRDNNSLLTNKRCLVIGYGKIGKSVANSLSAKNVTVWVFDSDPIRRAQALSHGYYTPDRDYALNRVDLIVGATGKKSLVYTGDPRTCDFKKLKNSCFVASVTSGDDEFGFGPIRDSANVQDNQNNIETFSFNDGKHFHLLAKGNAVNFTHNNALGPYIYMVSCEIIACMRLLIGLGRGASEERTIQELSVADRRKVASEWMSTFLEVRGAGS